MIGRAAYAVGSSEVAAYMSGVPIRRAKFAAYVLSGLLASIGGLFLTFFTYSGEASAANGNTYTLYSIAAVVLGGVSLFGGSGSAIGAIFGALMFRTIGDLLFVFDVDPLWQPLFQGVVLLVAVCLGAVRLFRVRNRLDCMAEARAAASDAGRGRHVGRDAPTHRSGHRERRSAASCCCCSSAASIRRSFLSPEYLLQQLKVASFLGVIATGMMLVILLGQIDLSVPWVVAVGGMMATAATGWGPLGEVLAIPVGIVCGVALGLVNGVGVAYLRIPSMIVTLAVNAVAQGLMVVHTGGFSPQDSSSRGDALPRHRLHHARHPQCGASSGPSIGAAAVFLLTRTTFGRAVYAIGNRERAAYLSGVDARASS